MTDLEKLIAAVDAGEWPRARVGIGGGGQQPGTINGVDSRIWRNGRQAFGGSLDAAHRLHEVLLPGTGWDIWRTLDHMPDGESRAMYGCNLPMIDTAYSPVASRAWLLAVLRALKAKGGHNEG